MVSRNNKCMLNIEKIEGQKIRNSLMQIWVQLKRY